ncbi:regulator of chromosome condensation 1/beta-lactamase-inhibitor protein II [Naematelia encephala]|uniref:Regulator of chromosome condensation 1/beta-lactamase-inhibitor protein II n=1 Tax=Naematelia encephala TaxID=71784 RepID=A0A1Y2AVU3_9TREE|nr:regulator of chromosome condensation 1/beta-lactamase-inhibitor protein II [Naematelia encephala]
MPPILLSCGSNGSSQLSLSHAQDVHTLTPCHFHPTISSLLNKPYSITDLVSSSTHSLAIVHSSELDSTILLGAGTNTLGQLGPRCALWDDVKPESRFKPVDLLTPLGLSADDWAPCKIATTWTTSFVVYRRRIANLIGPTSGSGSGSVSEEQMMIACGSNDFGELSIPSINAEEGKISITRPSDVPTIVKLGLEKGEWVEKVKGGQKHVLVLVEGGPDGQRLIGWGASRRGELDPTSTSSSKPKGKGKAIPYPSSSPPTPVRLDIPPGERIVDIALGANHSVALLSNGQVIAWGSDTKSQISSLGQVKGIKSIATTWGGTYLLTETGEIWSQGSNTHSQLLRSGEGPASRGTVQLPSGVVVGTLCTGSEHVMVINQERTQMWVGGWNEHGNLGVGDCADRHRLVAVDLVNKGRKIREVWGGCAATWVCLEDDPS